MAALTQQADAALAAANPQTPVGGGSLGPDGGLGGRYKYLNERDVFVNTHTGILLVLDWDLCLDFISTPYDAYAFEEDHHGQTIRDAIVETCGFSKEDHDDYWEKMWNILHTLVKLRDDGHCDIVIVTRNSVENVEAIIDECCCHKVCHLPAGFLYGTQFISKDFPIISYPENNLIQSDKKDKAQLLAECFPGVKSFDKVIFVDDSHGKPNREHERFAKSATKVFAPEATICHVMVKRCPRHQTAVEGTKKRKVPYPYGEQGLGNQRKKLDEIATHILGTVEHPVKTWDDAIQETKM